MDLRIPHLFTERVAAWRGGLRLGFSFVLGVLAAGAFPPFSLFPLLWISFPGLFLLLHTAKSGRESFRLGWTFAFGLLVARLHWIAASMLVDSAAFWWAIPLAVAGLPAFFALYYGVAAWVAFALGVKHRDGVSFFALAWMGAEMARAHLLTGMPWDILGYVWADSLPVLQSTSFLGIEGLTLATIFLAVWPAHFFFRLMRLRDLTPFIVFGLLAMWGVLRLQDAPHAFVDDVRLRLIQADQNQSLKWRPEQRVGNFQKLLDTSFENASGVTHIFWPETATAYYLNDEPSLRARIAERMPAGAILFSGTLRKQDKADGSLSYYNSIVVLDRHGEVLGGYDKRHLVPFGEYVPFSNLLPVRAVAGLGHDFSSGKTDESLHVPGLPPISPLICYEAIFSGEVVGSWHSKALVNLSNDAWYEGTIGPLQHFLIARVRAIEEGLPLVRVANKGVTAVVDPWGRVVAQSAVGAGYVDSPLPKALVEATAFQTFGRGGLWLMVLGALIQAVFLRGVRKNEHHHIF